MRPADVNPPASSCAPMAFSLGPKFRTKFRTFTV